MTIQFKNQWKRKKSRLLLQVQQLKIQKLDFQMYLLIGFGPIQNQLKYQTQIANNALLRKQCNKDRKQIRQSKNKWSQPLNQQSKPHYINQSNNLLHHQFQLLLLNRLQSSQLQLFSNPKQPKLLYSKYRQFLLHHRHQRFYQQFNKSWVIHLIF
ncbi:Hypothetical_protein [Hexamita inflata]|uniref:Hypothetical_protein n=1 Tax=Hexamita inflata TaxID=28002 RepID=A0AA86UF71_9EUKA|nr:Hypothetical protein HINF_LOCUS36407 [Hexamita inflata]